MARPTPPRSGPAPAARLASLVVFAHPGQGGAVAGRLARCPGAHLLEHRGDALAVLLEAPTTGAQQDLHDSLVAWPEVLRADVVFAADTTPHDVFPDATRSHADRAGQRVPDPARAENER